MKNNKNKQKLIFVAIDTSNINQVKKIISQTKTKKLKIIPKFGLQFFYSKNGRKFLENYKSEYWLDIKGHDIPQTVVSALDSLKDLKKLRYITVHASGGLEMLKAATKKARQINKSLKVLVVTILTSLNNKSVKDLGYKDTVEKIVLRQAALIKKSGAAGCVCSAREAKIIRKKYKNFFIVTPGIKLPGIKANWDQARVETPANAFKNNVSAIVIGRSLVGSGNIKNNLKRLIDHLS